MTKIRGGSGAQERPSRGSLTGGENLLKSHFTLVFEGNIRKFDRNPLMTDTPFGRPIVAGMGNAFAELDDFCQQRDEILEALQETWRVLRMAGLLNLTRGVQLGQTSWYVKMCDAEALSDAAIAKATSEGCAIKPEADGEGEADRTQIIQAQPSKEANPHG